MNLRRSALVTVSVHAPGVALAIAVGIGGSAANMNASLRQSDRPVRRAAPHRRRYRQARIVRRVLQSARRSRSRDSVGGVACIRIGNRIHPYTLRCRAMTALGVSEEKGMRATRRPRTIRTVKERVGGVRTANARVKANSRATSRPCSFVQWSRLVAGISVQPVARPLPHKWGNAFHVPLFRQPPDSPGLL